MACSCNAPVTAGTNILDRGRAEQARLDAVNLLRAGTAPLGRLRSPSTPRSQRHQLEFGAAGFVTASALPLWIASGGTINGGSYHDGRQRQLGRCRARADPVPSGPATLERQAALAAVGLIAAVGRETLARLAALNATGPVASSGIFWTTFERAVAARRHRPDRSRRRPARAAGHPLRRPRRHRAVSSAGISVVSAPRRPQRHRRIATVGRETLARTAALAATARSRAPAGNSSPASPSSPPPPTSAWPARWSPVAQRSSVPQPWRPPPGSPPSAARRSPATAALGGHRRASQPSAAKLLPGPRSSPPPPSIATARAEVGVPLGGSYGHRSGHRRRRDRGCARTGRRSWPPQPPCRPPAPSPGSSPVPPRRGHRGAHKRPATVPGKTATVSTTPTVAVTGTADPLPDGGAWRRWRPSRTVAAATSAKHRSPRSARSRSRWPLPAGAISTHHGRPDRSSTAADGTAGSSLSRPKARSPSAPSAASQGQEAKNG